MALTKLKELLVQLQELLVKGIHMPKQFTLEIADAICEEEGWYQSNVHRLLENK